MTKPKKPKAKTSDANYARRSYDHVLHLKGLIDRLLGQTACLANTVSAWQEMTRESLAGLRGGQAALDDKLSALLGIAAHIGRHCDRQDTQFDALVKCTKELVRQQRVRIQLAEAERYESQPLKDLPSRFREIPSCFPGGGSAEVPTLGDAA